MPRTSLRVRHALLPLLLTLVPPVAACEAKPTPNAEGGAKTPPPRGDAAGADDGATSAGKGAPPDGDRKDAARRPSPTRAPAPDLAAARAKAVELATAAGLTPAARTSGPELGAPVEGVERHPEGWRYVPDLPGEPRVVDTTELPFVYAPWSTIEDGALVVRFRTRVPTPAAALYVGLRLEEDPVAAPRFRHHQGETRSAPGVDHELRYPMDKLLSAHTDVNGVVTRGFGEVAWQVEVAEQDRGTSLLYDGRIAFAVAPGEAGLTATLLPTVVLGPLLHMVTETSAVVSFETDVPTVAALAVGDRPPVGSGEPGTRHEIRVEGLRAAHEYPYRVVLSDGATTSVTPPRTLTTRGPGPIVVAIMSDSRSGPGPGYTSYAGVNAAVLSDLMVGAYRAGAEAIFFPGDLIDGYVAHRDDFEYQIRAWLRTVEGVHGTIPIYTTMGNHEALVQAWSDGKVIDAPGDGSAEAVFASLMVNPGGAPKPATPTAPTMDENVYSVDLGTLHLATINTNYFYTNAVGDERWKGGGNREGIPTEGMLQWLEADLAAARERGAEHIIVLGHEPAFPAGGHTKDAMWWHGKLPEVNAIRERFWTILARHRTLAYVSGDEHNYSRALIGPETVAGASGSVYSIISGGCGAPYYAKDPPPEYAERLQAFSAQQHFTLFTFVEGQTPRLTVYGITGGVIEDLPLDGAG